MTSRNAKYGPLARGIRRDLSEKGWVPVRYWVDLVVRPRRRDGGLLRRPDADLARPPCGGVGGGASLAPPLTLDGCASARAARESGVRHRLSVLTSRRPEERVHLALRAEACDSVAGELARVALTSAGRVAERDRRRESPGRGRRCGATRGCRSTAPRGCISRRSVRVTSRGSHTRRGRSSQTTVSAASSTRSPSFLR